MLLLSVGTRSSTAVSIYFSVDLPRARVDARVGPANKKSGEIASSALVSKLERKHKRALALQGAVREEGRGRGNRFLLQEEQGEIIADDQIQLCRAKATWHGRSSWLAQAQLACVQAYIRAGTKEKQQPQQQQRNRNGARL